MKHLLSYALICSYFLACEVHSTASPDPHLSRAISVILDPSDQRAYWPSADKVLYRYHCKETPNAECLFRLRTISDRRLSPITTYRLADAESMEKQNTGDDPQFRENTIDAFYRMVRKSLNTFYTRLDSLQPIKYSECFRTITDELAFLAKNKSNYRELIIPSDLMEKSDLFNCYTSPLTNTQEIADRFEKTNLLPQNLKGITVTFLFNPRNRKEDEAFSEMIDVYKLLLQSKGADINVKANL